MLPLDGNMHQLHRTGFSSSAANLTDGVYENQLIPNFQRVTICGEDASEVCTAFCPYWKFGSVGWSFSHIVSVVWCDAVPECPLWAFTSFHYYIRVSNQENYSPIVLNDVPVETCQNLSYCWITHKNYQLTKI